MVNAKSTQEEVFKGLQSERRYQTCRWGRRQNVGEADFFVEDWHSVGDYLVFIRQHLRDAEEALTTTPSDLAALDEIRKLTALGIACLEQHGCPIRSNPCVINIRDGEKA